VLVDTCGGKGLQPGGEGGTESQARPYVGHLRVSEQCPPGAQATRGMGSSNAESAGHSCQTGLCGLGQAEGLSAHSCSASVGDL
jgi:hypothetical protein